MASVIKLIGPVVTLVTMLVVEARADFVSWSQCNPLLDRTIPRGAYDLNATFLHLYMCGLTEINATDLKGLPSLNKISLSSNFLQAIDPTIFKDVTQVEELDMNLNILEAVPVFGASAVLPNLKTLFLSLNKISKLDDPKTFSSTKELEILALGGNKITYIHPDMFLGLTKLKTLYLEENKLTNIDDRTFVIPSLTDLHLNHNVIENIAVGAFRGSNLKRLYLNGNKLTHLPGDLLTGPGAELRIFCYQKNPWQCAELTKIVKRENETEMICYDWSKMGQRMEVTCVS